MSRLTRAMPPAPLAASPVPPPAPARSASLATPPLAARAALWGVVLAAVAAAHFAADGAAAAQAAAADPELARLLRAMALLKAGMAAAAAWLAHRLLGRPLGAPTAAGLVLAAGMMAAAPVLMWHFAHVVAGAVLFHAGLALLLALGWRPVEALLEARGAGGALRRGGRRRARDIVTRSTAPRRGPA